MRRNKDKRLSRLEEIVNVRNYGLRVVMHIDVFYSDEDPENFLYWTDEPIGIGMTSWYDGQYREVQHPDGIRPTMKDM